jgi:hypothetical protein
VKGVAVEVAGGVDPEGRGTIAAWLVRFGSLSYKFLDVPGVGKDD